MRPRATDASGLLARCTFEEGAGPVDLAVSGGPDSCGLALLASAAGLDATLHHVDHQLREGSAREAAFVASLADAIGARFVAHTVVVDSTSNLEARARAARREALPSGTLTGHTMDDQAETVVLNLLRGAGLDGMGAMNPATKPMLGLRRHEVRAFVEACAVTPLVDSSNFDLSMRRNLVRLRVLPELSRVAARDIVPILARQAALAREDARFLDERALAELPDPCDVAALRGAPDALRRRRLRDLVRRRGDGVDTHPPSAAEVARMDAVVRGEATSMQLSGGRSLHRRSGRLRVEEP